MTLHTELCAWTDDNGPIPAVDGVFGPYRLPVKAVQHVRRMRGGAQSHMMRCADGFYYVVKFQNNPQHHAGAGKRLGWDRWASR